MDKSVEDYLDDLLTLKDGSKVTQGQAPCTQALGQRGQATCVLTDATGPAVQAV